MITFLYETNLELELKDAEMIMAGGFTLNEAMSAIEVKSLRLERTVK